jgi:hypothetical protein
MLYYPDAQEEPLSASDLIKQQQSILAINAENQKKRENLAKITAELEEVVQQLNDLRTRKVKLLEDMGIAEKSAEDLHDESTEALENNIQEVEAINNKVRTNMERDKAQDEAEHYQEQYDSLSGELEGIKKKKLEMLQQADLPLEGLSVEDGELVFNGAKWDCMSGADQLRVAVAIARKINPNCGFVLLDKLEQMDMETMQEFGEWLETEGLQVIATRVSTGSECSIIIEDGYVRGDYVEPVQVVPKFKEGEF